MDKMRLLDRLEGYGADMKGIHDRFLGDAELYEHCYYGLLEEQNFKLLDERMASHDYEGAFQCAHAIKGLAANLGLSPFHKKVHVLVEALRAHDYSNIDAQYADVRAAYERLKSMDSDEPPAEEEAQTPPPAEKAEKYEYKKEPRHASFIDSKRFIPTVATLTVAGIIFVVLLFSRLISSYYSNTDIENAGHLREISRQIELSIEERIESDRNVALSVYNSITKGADSEESFYAIMEAERDIWGVSDIILHTENGIASTASGKNLDNEADAQTAAMAQSFGEQMTIIDSAVIYTLPANTGLKLNGSGITAISVKQDLLTFLSDMDFSSFEGQAHIYLARLDGTIISRDTEGAGEEARDMKKLLERCEIESLEDGSARSADELFISDAGESFIGKGPSGGFYMISSPINTEHEPLRLFYLVQSSIVNRTMSGFSNYVINICVSMIVIFTAAVVLVFVVIYHNRRMQFDKSISSRERMFDLLVQNTSTVFALLSTEQDEPLYYSSNASNLMKQARFSLKRSEGGFKIIHHGTGTQSIDELNRSLSGWDGKSEFISGYIPTGGGLSRYYTLCIYPVKQSDTDFIAVAQDVTQAFERESTVKEALEMAERSNAAKDNFLSHMSHDFRTPLNAIINMTEFALSDMGDPAKQSEELHTVLHSSEILLDLINKVLDMSNIESGQLKLDSEPFDIRANISGVCSIVRPLCKEKNQTFITDFKGLSIGSVMGDHLKISQIFINLLSNAVKFTPKGGAIRFTAYDIPSIQKDIVAARFIVEDNGIGIAKDDVQSIFDPFYRAGDRRVRGLEGSGLGLSICKSYVSAMRGSISCESEPENGSTFTVELFFRRAAEVSQPKPRQPELSGALPFSGLRCLLCEDNSTNQLIGRSLLEKIGFMVECADDGRIGLQKFVSSKPYYYDIVYMDIQMPNMDGYQSSAAIRESSHPQAATVPIVALSANVFAEDIEKARLSGMNGYVGKPITVLNLIDETQKVLKKEDEKA